MYKFILQAAIEHYGEQMQMVVAMEELAELQKELSKAIRGKPDVNHIAEEIADVEIMLEQLKMIFQCKREVDVWKVFKLERLGERLEREENGESNKDNDPTGGEA